MKYLYETHMHTCLASGCGKSTGKEHARFYKEQGYTGIIMTDHFFGGNTCISRELPWEERIDLFWRGYEDAKEEGDRIGLDVFFGLEQNFQGDEYLIYGLDKDYMKAHPEMEHWTRREQLEAVHGQGGCVIQAHPFRIRDYMNKIRLAAPFCDGIEAANAGNDPMDDARARAYGKEMGFVMTAGSDNHHSPTDKLFGVILPRKLTCIQDYVNIILKKEQPVLKVPEERFRFDPTWTLDERHQAWELDENEKIHLSERQWITEDQLPKVPWEEN